MSFVSNSLQQEQTFRPPRKSDRQAASGAVDLFEPLCQRRHLGRLRQAQAIKHLDNDTELSKPSIDQQEIRRAGESTTTPRLGLLGPSAKPTFKYLSHSSEVIIALDRLDVEVAIGRFDGETIFKNHH